MKKVIFKQKMVLIQAMVFLLLILLAPPLSAQPPSYCTASTSLSVEWIVKVRCGAISNVTWWQGGVADYTTISTTINPGISQPITITSGAPFFPEDRVSVWVDWNNDYTFGTDNELLVLTNVGGKGHYFTGDINVPAGTATGNYRMRIRLTRSSTPIPCDNADYGEVEDYTIQIIPCPVVDAGTDATISKGEPYSLSDATAINDSSLQWTSTGDGVFNDANILHPVFTPGAGDIAAGSVQLCLTAYPISPCTTSATDCMILSFAESSMVYDGLTYTANTNTGLLINGDSLNIVNLGTDSLSVQLDLDSNEFFDTWFNVDYQPGAWTTRKLWGTLNNTPNQLIGCWTFEQTNISTQSLTFNLSLADQLLVTFLLEGNIVYQDTINNGSSIEFNSGGTKLPTVYRDEHWHIQDGWPIFVAFTFSYSPWVWDIHFNEMTFSPLLFNGNVSSLDHTDLIAVDIPNIIINRSISISASGSTVICPGDSVDLTCTTAANATLQWQQDEIDIPEATSATYTATDEGNYRVKVTVDNDSYFSKPIPVTLGS